MSYAKACTAILAFLFNVSRKRITVLVTHKEYDHLMQPIKKREYAAAALLLAMVPTLTLPADEAARWAMRDERGD